MPSGNSKFFIKLSKKLILRFQKEYSFDKTNDVISSELITTYKLSANEVEKIAELVYFWCQN